MPINNIHQPSFKADLIINDWKKTFNIKQKPQFPYTDMDISNIETTFRELTADKQGQLVINAYCLKDEEYPDEFVYNNNNHEDSLKAHFVESICFWPLLSPIVFAKKCADIFEVFKMREEKIEEIKTCAKETPEFQQELNEATYKALPWEIGFERRD